MGLKVLLKLRTTFLECLCSTRYMGVAFSQYSRKHPQSEHFEAIKYADLIINKILGDVNKARNATE